MVEAALQLKRYIASIDDSGVQIYIIVFPIYFFGRLIVQPLQGESRLGFLLFNEKWNLHGIGTGDFGIGIRQIPDRPH